MSLESVEGANAVLKTEGFTTVSEVSRVFLLCSSKSTCFNASNVGFISSMSMVSILSIFLSPRT